MAHRATRPARGSRLRLPVSARSPSAAVSVRGDGPHIRLGMVWALVTHVAAAAGPVPLAMVITPVAALAGVQAARSWRRRQRRAAVPISGTGAGLIAGASIFGIWAVGAAVLLVGCVLTAARLFAPKGPRAASPGLTGVIAVSFGLAGAALVLLRAEAFIPVFVLLSFVQVYDASAYVVGAGAASRWEGPAAGVASIAAVTLAVAAVLSPPFRGATPWLLGLLAAVLAPVGPLAAAELIGDRRARIPAVLRLDSLLVLGPVWALAAALSLD